MSASRLPHVVLLAFAVLGCGVGKDSINQWCPTVASTGGDPTGKWTVKSSCQVPYARTATDDWCSKLVYDANGVHDGVFLGQEFLPITSGTVTYTKDDPTCGENCGSYEAGLVFSGMTTTHFPLGCLKQHTPDPTCDDLTNKVLAIGDAYPTIQNFQCVPEPDDPDSCACSYLVTTATIATDVGAWRVKDGLLIHYPSTLAQAGLTDMAIVGNEMHLHGHDGLPLLAHDPLRNLDLERAQ
jgi:hypothetical protein